MDDDASTLAAAAAEQADAVGSGTFRGLPDSPLTGWVGPYRLVRLLGRGAQGGVYLAEDRRLGRRVALKVLPGAPEDLSEKALVRFRREAEATARLDHPGIAVVYEAGEADGCRYIAMRHVDGESLEERLAAERSRSATRRTSRTATASAITSRSGVSEVVLLVEQAARALHAAHESGIVHRDIKPGNIMITSDGQPVVLDFGLASLEGDSEAVTLSGDCTGTPAYMSPEQISGRGGTADHRTDVYSLGVTLYECLTLRRPFHAPTREGLFQAILTRLPPDPRTLNRRISRELQVVIDTAIEKDRGRRYQSALDLAEDLARIRLHQPIQARPAGVWRRVTSWMRRHPARSIAAVLGSVLLVGSVVAAITMKAAYDRAGRAEREATENLNAYRRLADVKRFQKLQQRFDELWPATPDRRQGITDLLHDSEALLTRQPWHRRTLATLRGRGELVPAGSADAGRVAWRFDAPEDEFMHRQLSGLVAGLDVLAIREGPPRPGTIAELRARLREASTISDRSTTGPAAALAWRECIADVATHPAYGGMRLTPQLGLLPIGQDPQSQLWEFAHLPSGEPPARDESGRLLLTEETSLVLVLIPPEAPSAAHPAPATLPGFFLSKFEFTQAQWQRVTQSNPSAFRAPSPLVENGLHPVERVSFDDCARVCRQLGLQLPTTTEWTYACVGVRHPAGSRPKLDHAALQTEANLGDDALFRLGGFGAQKARWDDGYAVHAPVGSFRPNPRGLHDMFGNVSEWCRSVDDARSPLSPLSRLGVMADWVPTLGGRWYSGPGECVPQGRATQRSPATEASFGTGLRPGRPVSG